MWLISDARNDGALDDALRRLPRGSGFIYRHYHLAPQKRAARFAELFRIARSLDHLIALADSATMAREWGADGIYGAPSSLRAEHDLIVLATAHDLDEIELANRIPANAVLISPVFATRSHPGTDILGSDGFHLLARRAQMPVIALGGMNANRAEALGWPRWGAIDGLA